MGCGSSKETASSSPANAKTNNNPRAKDETKIVKKDGVTEIEEAQEDEGPHAHEAPPVTQHPPSHAALLAEEASVHEASRSLRETYRTHGTGTWDSAGTAGDEAAYRGAIADAVGNMRLQIRRLRYELCSQEEVAPAPAPPDLAGIAVPSRDPRTPLCGSDLHAAYAVPLLQWLRALPQLLQSVGLRYTHGLIATFFADCDVVLAVVEDELHRNKPGKTSPIQYTDRTREHLSRAVKALYELRVAPETVAEEFTAVALYTLELLTDKRSWPEDLLQEKKGVITNNAVHGWNASLYGVMNWVSRVYRDAAIMAKLDETSQGAVATTVHVFLPLLTRIDVFLCRMPIERSTLYRGIRAPINLAMYAPGRLLSWSALSSTSRDYKVAHEFGNTLFVVNVHNASTIDFLTYFPGAPAAVLHVDEGDGRDVADDVADAGVHVHVRCRAGCGRRPHPSADRRAAPEPQGEHGTSVR